MTPAALIRSLTLAAALAAALPAAAAGADRVEKQREWFTNTTLVTQDGKEVRFFDDVLKDQVVVIQFIFTRCEGACPLTTQKLIQTRAALGGALGDGLRFVSISVDPTHDGPAQLRAFARKQGAAVPGWILLAGAKPNVDLVVKRLGQYVEAPEDHATVFIAGNARTNHWVRVRPDAPPAAIAQQLRELAAGEPRTAAVN
jgi:cytochrome oxidase Cu insertion factor (SCO1/SenC/PrrC family)